MGTFSISPDSRNLETHERAAGEFTLVDVFQVANDRAIVEVAPVAVGLRRDIRRCPASCSLNAKLWREKHFHTATERHRELVLGLQIARARTRSADCGIDRSRAELRPAKTDKQEGANLRITVEEIVSKWELIVPDVQIRNFRRSGGAPNCGAAIRKGAFLLGEHETKCGVFTEKIIALEVKGEPAVDTNL